MPPFFPRKRLRSSSPEPESEPGPSRQQNLGGKKSKLLKATPRKATLFDDLDAGAKSPEDTKAILKKIQATDDDDDDSSSLSSLSEDEFEDVPNTNRQQRDDATDDEDEDIEFEDVETNLANKSSANIPTGDLELTLTKETRISLTNPLGTKKGPSKIERGIRTATHQIHVQMLMWHNAIRNSWLCDKELQEILVGQLPETVLREIEKWRKDSGIQTKPDNTSKSNGKGKGKVTKGKKVDVRSQRDWGEPAERQEAGQINMSRGDPMFRLLRLLMNYWKQRFRIITPGLRKVGYMSLDRLDQECKSFQKDEGDFERHGERIVNIDEFKKCAKALEGSRDVGAQLFTALLRGIGIESRMIASLQPVGFGWNKNEDAAERKDKKRREATPEDDTSDAESSEEETPAPKSAPKPSSKPASKPSPKSAKKVNGKWKFTQVPNKPTKPVNKPARRSSRGNGLKDAPIDLSESEELSMANVKEEDDESVVDITPAKTRVQPSKPYDKDLLFPHYWTEVLSPVTNTYTPIDPLVLKIIATNSELLQKFESRGAKADKAKQVTAYIVGHSPDGTAKDVTIRYLKGHMLPGRTKGNRFPIEKLPIYNSKGKVKRYEFYDWFKTVISGYVRGSKKFPRTEIDDHEEATDLKAVQPKKKEVKEGEETLQSYKSSTEHVLERHLRREEAILDTAKHVKMFNVKAKGDNPTEEKVWLRKDVVSCKSLETWHKEGRAPLPGAIPRKRVPYRAATTNRKRELAEAELESGQKMLQGLYSRDQTDWIIPPPIVNGVIPKNNYGNMDVYVQSMVPVGAVHIPRRGTKRICTRLGIDYAEAVTGFEFGARMAIPIITGVVVAEENLERVMEQWEKDESERVRKEDVKKTQAAINMWRKMLMSLRIIERMTEEYGSHGEGEVDLVNPFSNKNKKWTQNDEDSNVEEQAMGMQQKDEDIAGGFFPEGYVEEELEGHHPTSFFPVVASQEDGDGDGDDGGGGGGFIVEDEDENREKANGIRGLTSTTITSTSPPFQFIGNGNGNDEFDTEINGTSDEDEDSESDEEMHITKSKIEKSKTQTPAPASTSRGRGRPAGSSNKTPAPSISKPASSNSKVKQKSISKPKTITPAKRVVPVSRASSKRKRKRICIPDSEDDDEDDEEDVDEGVEGEENMEENMGVDLDVDVGMDDEENEDEDIDIAPPPPPEKAVGKKAVVKKRKPVTVAMSQSQPVRITPRRNAKRVSGRVGERVGATELRSRYFEHGGGGGDRGGDGDEDEGEEGEGG
ncbi:putative DNA repair protein rhp42 [Sclerotinia borealis F-4128]|uniref:Putative DNA repair protein rhp42 n=1 Tax=Sclerotinia borealis (strain F-4128) TaxID=1432307 RepID=W9C1A9_SCLBF|nr:putative DNA repair protein rhp42 [Sclerotinia borealis F-4128]